MTVCSKPNCVQCTATYRALDRQGIEYQVVDLTGSDAALEYVTQELGDSQAPVVVVDEHDHWSGFRPDKITQHAAAANTRR
ncbi:NrdH-redoxin [Cryobacterium zongtaii]|uniref:Glutaredoxin-like protein NrdH n=1 Tax=Cryobacterium zongtaii TaxID=1259217 RepID=A0A2S3Z5U2_9MICO|nr:glutaredoxin-like protein NrdH [Cryobacterium zongtaii]POH59618.1 NrdH-redoxin [Cryobacterium zongtaii]